jgi:hypothetical protein
MQARLLAIGDYRLVFIPTCVRLLEPRELTVVREPRVRGDRRRSLAPPEPCPSRGARLGWSH